MGNTIKQLKHDQMGAIQDDQKQAIAKFFEFAKTKEKLLLSEFKQQGTVAKADFEINIDKVIGFHSHFLFVKQDGPDKEGANSIKDGIKKIIKADWADGITDTVVNLMDVIFGNAFGAESKDATVYFHIGPYGSITRIDIMAYRKQTEMSAFGFTNAEQMLVVCWRLASVKMQEVDHSTFFAILDAYGSDKSAAKSAEIVANWEKYRTMDTQEPPAKRRKLNDEVVDHET